MTSARVMMPIVFWASLVPWLSASARAVRICERLKNQLMRGDASPGQEENQFGEEVAGAETDDWRDEEGDQYLFHPIQL